jgi:hypothetical protein
MRDGIYKNLPLPTRWQAVLKSCTLDAERGAIAREKVERAIGQDLLREIQPQFKKAFREKAKLAESLLPGLGFRAFGLDVTNQDLGGQDSPMENEAIAQARRLEGAGVKGAQLEGKAYIGAIEANNDRHRRLMEQTVLTSGSGPNGRATIIAVRNALKAADSSNLVSAFVSGDSLDLPPARRKIDLDEDLIP